MEVARPLVSVIMNCYNSETYLREAMQSVYNQTYDNWEIIFWDNASTDGSAAIANSFDDRVKYYRGEKTIPLGEARNEAIARATGTYIAFLDCDDLWLPEKLEKQLPLFERDAEIGLVFCDTAFFNSEGTQKQVYAQKKPPTGYVFEALLSEYFLALPSVVVRRSALEQMDHWFDPRFNIIEEYDLFVRLSRSWRLDYVDEPLAKWRMHQASWTFSKRELGPREKEMMVAKLKAEDPTFEEQYGAALAQVQARIAISYALLDLEQGKGPSARRRLRPHLRGSKRAWIYFLFTFVPFSWYRALYRDYSSIKPE